MNDVGLVVLVVGSGAREHALYQSIARSPRVSRVLVAPGNGGIPAADRRPVRETDDAALIGLARNESVDLVVIGPEAPLVAGVGDRLAAAGVTVFGPSAEAARLEGSKAFAKDLCRDLGVPTADYRLVTSLAEAEAAVAAFGAPVVVKADGLCAGKGVTVAATAEEALEAARQALVERVFGPAGERLVIERCLSGPECSVMAICDGESAVLLPPARDHKRAFDGDRGPNTGGMGAYAPLPTSMPRCWTGCATRSSCRSCAGWRRAARRIAAFCMRG